MEEYCPLKSTSLEEMFTKYIPGTSDPSEADYEAFRYFVANTTRPVNPNPSQLKKHARRSKRAAAPNDPHTELETVKLEYNVAVQLVRRLSLSQLATSSYLHQT